MNRQVAKSAKIKAEIFNAKALSRRDAKMDEHLILEAHKHIWTTDFNDYVLVQANTSGEVDYAIYHLPRRSFLVIEDDTEDQLVIAKMLEMGIRIIDVEDLR